MKRFIVFLAIFIFAAIARAGLESVSFTSGDTSVPSLPARAVAFVAMSTNLTGTVRLEAVKAHETRWKAQEVVTTTNYVDVATNLSHIVTNDVVTVWRTHTVGNGVVETNAYAQAVNETPTYPDWPNMFVTTNKVVESEIYTNWTYQVVGSVTVTTNTVDRIWRREWSNTLVNASLSGGIFTNRLDAILFPGERLRASGTAFNGGSATLMLEK